MAAPVLATYSTPNWFQRHRWLCIVALVAFAFVYSAFFTLIGRFLMLQFMIPLIVLLFLVVWILPENDRPPTRLMEVFAFAYLAALLCWPDYLAIAIPGLPWITLLRLTGFPMAFLLLMSISMSPTFRAEMKERLNAVPFIWKALVVFFLIGLASVAWSGDPGFSFNKFVVALVNWFIPFFVAVYVFSKPRRVIWLGHILWGIAIFVSLIGFQEWRHSQVPWAGRIPSFLAVQDEAVLRILAGAARSSTGIYRVQSKFTTSGALAEFLSFALPFIIHIMVKTNRLWVRLAAGATIPLVIWALVKTDARLGMVGLFMSLLFYALAWGIMRWRSDKTSIFGPALTIAYPAIFTAFITATFFVGRLRALVWGTGAQSASTETRKAMYREGMPMILKNPVGHGFGRGAETLGFVNGNGILTIDTYYLSIGLEFGILGFIAYYGMFLVAIWQGTKFVWRAPRGETLYLVPTTIALAIFVIEKSVFSQQENHPLVFILLGVAVALMWRAKVDEAARDAAAADDARAATEPAPRGL
ncbi:hypothetical protein ASG29_00120 [Sphingomonas sp. Leaf412]|nr:hypothetical protein ASG29_00120 [Sphingomonas sp. Leaf412]